MLEEFPNFTATGVYGDAELLSCPGSESRGPGGVVPDYLDTIKRNDEVYNAVQEMRRILIEGTKRDYAELTHGKSGRELERAEAKFRQSYGLIGDDEGSVDIANTPLNFWT